MIECTLFRGKKLYKVLSAGKSAHGGDLQWSLPTHNADGTWTPGEWHETPAVALCSKGLHLTWEPARWHCSDLEVYEVEAEGIGGSDDLDCKVVARRCRLLRRLVDAAELLAVRVVLTGHAECSSGMWLASGSATVQAYGSATVRASGSATVQAYDSATVRAYDSATVQAYDSATVRAYDSACCTSTRWAVADAPLAPAGQAVHIDRRGGAVVIVVADPTITLRCDGPAPASDGEMCEGRR